MAKRGPKGPSKYYPELCEEIIEFFDIEPYRTIQIVTKGKQNRASGGYERVEIKEVANDLPHLVTFARKIGVTYETIRTWGKKYPEFSAALKEVSKLREKIIETNTLKGLYNPSFAIFNAKNTLGWRDEQYLKGDVFKQIIVFGDKPKAADASTRIGQTTNNA